MEHIAVKYLNFLSSKGVILVETDLYLHGKYLFRCFIFLTDSTNSLVLVGFRFLTKQDSLTVLLSY